MAAKSRKALAGLFLIGSPRFRELGRDTENGSYHDRKNDEVSSFVKAVEQSADVSFPGIIYEREQVSTAIKQFVADDVDCIIAGFISWAEDFSWIRFLRDMPDIPVMFINPVKSRVGFINTFEESDFVEFLCSGGLVGALEASGSIKRLGRANSIIIVDSIDEIYGKINIFAAAAKAVKIMKSSCFGLLSGYNPLMWSTYVDPYNLFARIGPELKFISYSAYEEAIRATTDIAASKEVIRLKDLYRIDDDVDEDKLRESVRASLTLESLSQKLDIDAVVLNDVDPELFRLVGLRPGFYPESFHENMKVLVPEADIGAAVITYMLKLVSGRHVNFIEPFYIEEETGCFIAGHAGPNDHTDIGHMGNVRISRDVRFAKTNYKYAGAPFAWYRIPAGRKTMAHFSECNGSYKIVCTLVDALEGEHFITSYSHGVFRPSTDVKELFGKILDIGVNQHFALVDGDFTLQLEYYARLMNFQYYKI